MQRLCFLASLPSILPSRISRDIKPFFLLIVVALVCLEETFPPFSQASCLVLLVAQAIAVIEVFTFPSCVGRDIIVRIDGACVVVAVPVLARPAIRPVVKGGLYVVKLIVVTNIGWERELLFVCPAVDGGAGEALELGGVSESHQSGDSDLDHLFDNVLFFCQTVS